MANAVLLFLSSIGFLLMGQLRTQFIHTAEVVVLVGPGPFFGCVWFVLLWFAFDETQIWPGDLRVVVCCFCPFFGCLRFLWMIVCT